MPGYCNRLQHALIQIEYSKDHIEQHYVKYPAERPFGATVDEYIMIYLKVNEITARVMVVEDGMGNKMRRVIQEAK